MSHPMVGYSLLHSLCHSHLQDVQGGLRELQAIHLNPREGDAAINSGNHFEAHEGQEGDLD